MAAVLVLASYRITRLVAVDVIADRPRTWVAVKAPVWVGKLVTCAICAGFWISAAVLAAWYFGGSGGWVVLVVFAIAGAQALLAIVDRAFS